MVDQPGYAPGGKHDANAKIGCRESGRQKSKCRDNIRLV